MIRCALIFALVTGAFAAPHRIVNGTVARDGEFPFIVSLRYFFTHSCGASILNEKWILTAAHCVNGFSWWTLSVSYGTNKIDGYTEKASINVWDIIIHEDFDEYNLFADIALVELASPIPFGPRAQPVILPKQNDVAEEGSLSTVIGWGLDRTGGTALKDLQKVDLFIVDWMTCDSIHRNQVFDSNICAGVPGGGKGQCSGDSGGPLTADGIQVGIVSWSEKPCGVAPYPGVFTQVSSYRSWIREKTGV